MKRNRELIHKWTEDSVARWFRVGSMSPCVGFDLYLRLERVVMPERRSCLPFRGWFRARFGDPLQATELPTEKTRVAELDALESSISVEPSPQDRYRPPTGGCAATPPTRLVGLRRSLASTARARAEVAPDWDSGHPEPFDKLRAGGVEGPSTPLRYARAERIPNRTADRSHEEVRAFAHRRRALARALALPARSRKGRRAGRGPCEIDLPIRRARSAGEVRDCEAATRLERAGDAPPFRRAGQPMLEFVQHEPAAQLRLEPRRFGRHDLPRVRDGEELFDARGEH
jgi:hypothetical protein